MDKRVETRGKLRPRASRPYRLDAASPPRRYSHSEGPPSRSPASAPKPAPTRSQRAATSTSPTWPDASLCIVKLLVGLGLSFVVQPHDKEECVPGPLGLSLVASTQTTLKKCPSRPVIS